MGPRAVGTAVPSGDWTPERSDLGGRPRSGVRRVTTEMAHICRYGRVRVRSATFGTKSREGKNRWLSPCLRPG